MSRELLDGVPLWNVNNRGGKKGNSLLTSQPELVHAI